MILALLEESIILNRLQGASAEVVKNGFFANYLAALVLMRLQDLKGLMLINDPAHVNLTSFTDKMSDLNFWAKALFFPNDTLVTQRMITGQSNMLNAVSRQIVATRKMSTVKNVLSNPESLNWEEICAELLHYENVYQIHSTYFNSLLRVLYKWDDVTEINKRKAIYDAFMYLMQSDPRSALLPRLRELANKTMTSNCGGVAMKVVNVCKINEDDGGGTSTGNIASGDSSVGGNAIITPPGFDAADTCKTMDNGLGGLYKLNKLAPKQVTKKGRFTIRDGKIVKKKVKGFKFRKFKAPDFMKVLPTGEV